MCIFFSEMTEIQLIINFGGHWERSIYQGGDAEIILVDIKQEVNNKSERINKL